MATEQVTGIRPIDVAIGAYRRIVFGRGMSYSGASPIEVNSYYPTAYSLEALYAESRKLGPILDIVKVGSEVPNPYPEDRDLSTSSYDTEDKFTEGCQRCLGLVMVGTDMDSGQNASVLAHIGPSVAGLFGRKELSQWLRRGMVGQFVERTDPSTRALTVIGGLYTPFAVEGTQYSEAEVYTELLKRAVGSTEQRIQTHALILPPKINFRHTNLYFQNNSRLAFVSQNEAPSIYGDEPFFLDEFSRLSKEWHATWTERVKIYQSIKGAIIKRGKTDF
jgi:hypothetical protein